jgi:tetratricopeptide (TPR) repeat protein
LHAGNYRLYAGQYEEAKVVAERILERESGNILAQILLGNSLLGLKDIDGAVREMEEAVRLDPTRGATYSSLGAAQMLKGRRDEAEKAFVRAVSSDPKSIAARLALANFYIAEARFGDAEQALKNALTIDSRDILTNRALAAIYLSSNRAALAEPLLKVVADVSPQPDADFQLADVYVATRRERDARSVLERLLTNKQAQAEARLRIAALDYAAGNRAVAHAGVDEVLKASPRHVQGLILKGEFLLSENKPSDALTSFQVAAAADAQSIAARYGVGRSLAAVGRAEEAQGAMTEVLKLNPRAASAQIALSRLSLAQGAAPEAVSFARDAVESAPQLPAARVALVRSLLGARDVDRAQVELARLLEAFPKEPVVRDLAGRIRLARKDLGGAEREFLAALDADPNSLSALEGLLYVDLSRGQGAKAAQRVSDRVAKSPDNPDVLLLAASTFAAARDYPAAESALRKVVTLDPSRPQAYERLSQLYLRLGKLPEARRELEVLAQKMPKSVGVHTTLAYVLDAQSLRAEARSRYEQVLQLDPRAPVASNNLAWIYAEEGTNLDAALTLAQNAKAQFPNSPEVNDTLGWVYYKKGLTSLAVTTLETSVAQQPQNAVFRYHLGMAHAKAGKTVAARRELETAIKLQPEFPGIQDARATLVSLSR